MFVVGCIKIYFAFKNILSAKCRFSKLEISLNEIDCRDKKARPHIACQPLTTLGNLIILKFLLFGFIFGTQTFVFT